MIMSLQILRFCAWYSFSLLFLAQSLSAENILGVRNALPKDEVTVVIFAKKDSFMAKKQEIGRFNIEGGRGIMVPVPADHDIVKYDIYYPAIKPVAIKNDHGIARRISVERGMIELGSEKPTKKGRHQFDKAKQDQHVELVIDTTLLGIQDKPVAVAAPAKPLTQQETKRVGAVGGGAGVEATSPKNTASPMQKTSTKTKIPRWTGLSPAQQAAKKAAQVKREADRKVATGHVVA